MSAVIGILAQIDDEKNTKIASAYASAVESSGGIPVILPYTESEKTIENFVDICDGILFSGGCDIEPKYYGEQPTALCGAPQSYRDELEFAMFRKAFAIGKPILGICRGAQLINVALGGTLYQDIPSEVNTEILHRQAESTFSPSHSVRIEKGTPLFALIENERMIANSFHHQAIKKLAETLRAMAFADDGIIEAIYAPDYSYLRAYQWHPERLSLQDANNKRIFDEFIQAALGKY